MKIRCQSGVCNNSQKMLAIAAQFEGALGRLTAASIHNPRQMISVHISTGQEFDEARGLEVKRFKELLLRIEKVCQCYCFLLRICHILSRQHLFWGYAKPCQGSTCFPRKFNSLGSSRKIFPRYELAWGLQWIFLVIGLMLVKAVTLNLSYSDYCWSVFGVVGGKGFSLHSFVHSI